MKKTWYLLLTVFVALIAAKAMAQNNHSLFMSFFNEEKYLRDKISQIKDRMERETQRTKDFLMRALLKEVITPHLRCRYISKYTFIYTDRGSGGKFDLGVWRPVCPEGWVSLGDLAIPSMSEDQPKTPILIVKWDDNNPAGDEKGPFLAKPIRYDWVWDDQGSGAHCDCSFWRPIPPEGYVAMGFVANNNFGNPNDLNLIRCVRKDLVYPAKWVGHIYIDKGTRAKFDCGVWSYTVHDNYKDQSFVIPNTFFVHNSHSGYPVTPAWVLKGISSDDAYNDTRNGYVNVAAKSFVGRIQQAVTNSRQARQKELEQKISGLSPQAATDRQIADGPTLDETLVSTEKNENRQDASHNLHRIDITTSQFKDIFAAIQKQGPAPEIIGIPALSHIPILKGLKFENAVLSQGSIVQGDEKGQPWLSVDGNAVIDIENVGEIKGRVIFLARLFKKTGLMMGAIVNLPTTDFLKKFNCFDQKPLDQIGLSDTAFTVANGDHEWLLKDFPEKIRKDLASFASNDDTAFPFTDGKGAWLSAEVKNNSILAAPFSILKTQSPKVMFSAIFPKTKDETIKIRAKLLTGFDPKLLPIGDFLKLGLPTIEFTLGDLKNIAILTELKLNLAKLNLNIPLRMDFPIGVKLTSFSVTGFLPCKWENALGIPGFSLSDIGISGSFGKLPSLALSGLFELSADWKLEMMGALSFTSPIGLSGLSCKLGRDIGIGDLINLHSLLSKAAFPKIPVPEPGKIDLPLIDLKLRDPFFCVSQIDIPPLNIREGITCSGTLLLGKTELGGGYFWMLKDKGIECRAWVKQFGFGPLQISGAGPDKKQGNKDDCPILDLAYWPLRQPPYTLDQHCYISGNTSILKTIFDVFINLKKDSVDLAVNGNLQNELKLYLFAEGKSELLKDLTRGGRLKCSGEVSGDFSTLEAMCIKPVENLAPVKSAVEFFRSNLLKIKSIKVSGSLDDLSKGLLPEAEICGSIFGFAFSIKEPMDFVTGRYIESWTTRISAMIKEKAESFLANPADFVLKAAGKVAELGQEVGDELIKAMGKSPEETWKSTTKAAEDFGEEAKKAAEQSGKIAVDTAAKAVNKAILTGKGISNTMRNAVGSALSTVSSWF